MLEIKSTFVTSERLWPYFDQVRVDNNMGTFVKVRKIQGNRGFAEKQSTFDFKPRIANNFLMSGGKKCPSSSSRLNLKGLHLKASVSSLLELELAE